MDGIVARAMTANLIFKTWQCEQSGGAVNEVVHYISRILVAKYNLSGNRHSNNRKIEKDVFETFCKNVFSCLLYLLVIHSLFRV